MKKWQHLVLPLVGLVLLGGGFGLGRITAPQETAQPQTATQNPWVTFYATILEHNDTNLLVEGLEVNDINYRSQFTVPLTDDTPVTWCGESHTIGDLAPGQTISVSFSGDVRESYPAQLTGDVALQILDNTIAE